MSDAPPAVSLRDVHKGWMAGNNRVDVLRGIDLDIPYGRSLAVVGPSGAGKSTLLHVIGLLTPVDRGKVLHRGQEVPAIRRWWSHPQRHTMGFIFQDAKLIPNLSVLENVCVPLLHRGLWPATQRRLAAQALERVGLDHRLGHLPKQLSGGELMRAGIARSLVMNPSLLLADEPTGTLDSVTGAKVAQLLLDCVAPWRAVVIVTHQQSLAERADDIIRILDGKIDG